MFVLSHHELQILQQWHALSSCRASTAHTIALELRVGHMCLYFDDIFIAILYMTKRWQRSVVLVQVRLQL